MYKFPKINSNILLRILFGVPMLLAFLQMSKHNKSYLVVLSFLLCIGTSIELIFITKRGNGFTIHPIVITCISACIFLANTVPALILLYPNNRLFQKLLPFKPAVFACYSISLMLSIRGLKRKLLADQLIILTSVHVASFVCSMVCAVSIRNILYGKFFYVYPSLLVIFNDIFAYAVGMWLGRTPLIALSPKKTVEGFIGGFFFTFAAGLVLSCMKINGNFIPDSNDSELARACCNSIRIPWMYIHNISFVLAASFFAPFSGFLASAIKRVFDKKDFSPIIPGHGGILDRFDCQLLMVFFTYYYIRMFFDPVDANVSSLYEVILENLKPNEIKELSKKLINKGLSVN